MSTAHAFEKFLIDGVPNTANPIQVLMDKDITVQAVYSDMGTVNISGSVSAQAAPGETVTITITKPDLTKVTQTAATLADRTFASTFTGPAGNYSVVFSIAADADYQAATSASVPFTIGLLPRTITGIVS